MTETKKNSEEQYCIVTADRLQHDTVVFIGTKEECKEKSTPWFRHKRYGGINTHIVKYDERRKDLIHEIGV